MKFFVINCNKFYKKQYLIKLPNYESSIEYFSTGSPKTPSFLLYSISIIDKIENNKLFIDKISQDIKELILTIIEYIYDVNFNYDNINVEKKYFKLNNVPKFMFSNNIYDGIIVESYSDLINSPIFNSDDLIIKKPINCNYKQIFYDDKITIMNLKKEIKNDIIKLNNMIFDGFNNYIKLFDNLNKIYDKIKEINKLFYSLKFIFKSGNIPFYILDEMYSVITNEKDDLSNIINQELEIFFLQTFKLIKNK